MGQSITELINYDLPQFRESIDIYESSFPSNETRSAEKVEEMLKSDDNYHLYIFLSQHEVAGISLMYTFKDLRMGLLDYMAVTPNNQGKGIGTALFNFTLKKFQLNVLKGIGLLMEIQNENVPDQEEKDKRIRRIRFYSRLGVKILDGVNYWLPPLQPEIESEEMYLMIRPLVKMPYLSKASTISIIDAIHTHDVLLLSVPAVKEMLAVLGPLNHSFLVVLE